jgi:hypothetical protein
MGCLIKTLYNSIDLVVHRLVSKLSQAREIEEHQQILSHS